MGALTSNRKRGDEYSSPYQHSPDFHKSKKAKSSMHQSPDKPIISSNSTVSRISQYPGTNPHSFRRAVHAPVRNLKFGFAKSKPIDFIERSKEEGGFNRDMGNIVSSSYDIAKSRAFGTLRFWGRGKEVVDVDNERKSNIREEVILSDDDSSVEEVQVIEKGKLPDVVSNHHVVDLVDELNFQPSSSSILTDGDLQVNEAPKLVDSLSFKADVSESDLEAYQKLRKKADRNNSKLEALYREIQYNEAKRLALQSLRSVKPAEPEIPREPFIPIQEEDEAQVKRAFSNRNHSRVLVTHQNSGIDITGKMLQCLRPGQWLNDEVINVYLELLKERESRDPKKFLKCHFFNTFFYNKLRSGGFKAVKRWTTIRKLGYYLVDCDKIFIPIHRQIHWCLAIINAKDKKFQYLDSLMGRDPEVLKSLASYYVEEVKDKSGKVIDVSSWEMEFVEDLPEQENGFDCGMFMVKYADFYSRGVGLCFDQTHMPYFRTRTANEILRLRAD